MEKVPMTPEGHQRLVEEIKRLKSVERPRIINAISEARLHGDLSENAEYHAAKERQSHIETRIRQIEDKLARAQVIDPTGQTGESVRFGATVVLEDAESGSKVTYTILGEDESDVSQGQISIKSPVARALMGKAVGDAVSVRVPKGTRELEILEIRFE
jgi:transcription elongation factor GreA